MNFEYIPDAGYEDKEKQRALTCYDLTPQNYKLLVMQVRTLLDYQKFLERKINKLEQTLLKDKPSRSKK